jgi:hypothetical protein
MLAGQGTLREFFKFFKFNFKNFYSFLIKSSITAFAVIFRFSLFLNSSYKETLRKKALDPFIYLRYGICQSWQNLSFTENSTQNLAASIVAHERFDRLTHTRLLIFLDTHRAE